MRRLRVFVPFGIRQRPERILEKMDDRRKKKRGISFLEYALLAALVGIVGAVGVMKYGKAISDFFSSLGDKTAEVTPKTK